MKKLNSRDEMTTVKMDVETRLNPRRMESKKSWEKETSNKSCCKHISEAIPLICKNFKLK